MNQSETREWAWSSGFSWWTNQKLENELEALAYSVCAPWSRFISTNQKLENGLGALTVTVSASRLLAENVQWMSLVDGDLQVMKVRQPLICDRLTHWLWFNLAALTDLCSHHSPGKGFSLRAFIYPTCLQFDAFLLISVNNLRKHVFQMTKGLCALMGTRHRLSLYWRAVFFIHHR